MKSALMRMTFISLSLFFLFASIPSNSIAEKRIALVIGNGSYSSSPLKNPVNDAADMADILKKMGFNVILKTNVSKREMGRAVENFGTQLKKKDVGLFFYAGHAVQVGGVNYLIPIGANIIEETDVEYEALDTGRILSKMHHAKSRVNIVILDACRDNPYAHSFRSTSRGLAIIAKAPVGTIISYSTSPGDVAFDGKGRNSPYTSSLMKYMKEPALPVEHVFKKTREKITQETNGRQIPWELSSLQGDFCFVPGSIKIAADRDDETKKLELEERSVAEPVEQRQAENMRDDAKQDITNLSMAQRPSIPTVKEIKRDGRFIAYDNGTVLDTRTNLMWAAKDNGSGISWNKAYLHCHEYKGGGYTDWRMPTHNELASLHDQQIDGMNGYNVTRLIELTNCCPWASNGDGAYFRFDGGTQEWTSRPFVYRAYRALPVRSVK